METVLILIVCGALLLVLETVLPGLVAGVLGALCLIAAVVTGYIKFDGATAHWIAAGVMAGVVAGAVLWLKFFPGSAMARKFVSVTTVGELGGEPLELLHQVGVAHTMLRPSGTALIAGKRVDVVSDGTLVDRGQAVKVVAVEGMRVVVRAV